jgi:hypothetical protein
MKASSSACTKRFQRSSCSDAPASGLKGDACAQAWAHSARLAALAPASVAPVFRTLRRVKLLSNMCCVSSVGMDVS